MAIKYSENTSYKTGLTSAETNNRQLMASIKAAKKVPAQTGKAIYSPVKISSNNGVSAEEQRAAITPYINSGVSLRSALPTGALLSNYKNLTGKKYSSIVDPTTKDYTKTANFLSPNELSPQTKFQSLSEMLGGGSYLLDPNNPGRAIQSERSFDYQNNQLLRQGLDPGLYQIDHIQPLWAGGADVDSNKEILTTVEHDKKTKIQAIPYSLMTAGKISAREALSMAMNWKERAEVWNNIKYPEPSKDPATSGLIVDKKGRIDTKELDKILKKWNETPKVSIKTMIKGIPEVAFNASKKIADKVIPKDAAGTREFLKGFTSGIVPGASFVMPELDTYGTYSSAGKTKVGKVSHVLGSIVGNVVMFAGAYKLALKGLAKAGVGFAKKELSTAAEKQLAKEAALLAKKEARGVGAMLNTADAERNIGTANKIKAAFSADSGVTAGFIEDKLGKQVIKTIAPELKKSYYWSKNIPKALTMGAISAGIGQLRPLGDTRSERLAADFAMGLFSPVGRASYTLRGYSRVAAPAIIIGMAEGYSPGNSATNALAMTLINAGTMVGMHGMGQVGQAVSKAMPAGSTKIPGIWADQSPMNIKEGLAQQEVAVKRAGLEFATDHLNSRVNEVKDAIRKGSIKDVDLAEIGINPKGNSRWNFELNTKTTPYSIQKQSDILDNFIKWKAKNGKVDASQAKIERQRVLASSKIIYHNTLPPVLRTKAEMADALSIIKRMENPTPTSAEEVPAIVNRVNVSKNLTKAELETPPIWKDVAEIDTPEGKKVLADLHKGSGTEMGLSNKQGGVELRKAIADGDVAFTIIDKKKIGEDNVELGVKFILTKVKDGIQLEDGSLSKSVIKISAVKKNGELIDLGHVSTKENIQESIENAALSKDRWMFTPKDPNLNNVTLTERMNSAGAEKLLVTGRFMKTKRGMDAVDFVVNDDSFNPEVLGRLNGKAAISTAETKTPIIQEKAFDLTPPTTKKLENLKKDVAAKKVVLVQSALKSKYGAEDATLADDAFFNSLLAKGETIKSMPEQKATPAVTSKKIVVPLPAGATAEQKTTNKSLENVFGKNTVEETNPAIKSFPSENNPLSENAKVVPKVNESNAEISTPKEMDTEKIVRDKSSSRDYRTVIDNKLQGFDKNSTFQIEKKGLSADSLEAIALKNYQKTFGSEEFPAKAKEMTKQHGGDEDKAYEVLVQQIDADYKKMGFESPLKNAKNKKVFKSLFKKSAQDHSTDIVMFDLDGDGKMVAKISVDKPKAANPLQEMFAVANEENGTDVKLVSARFGKQFSKSESRHNLVANEEAMYDADIVPVGYTDNSPDSLIGFKYDKFYANGEPDIRKGAPLFFENVMKKVLGIEDNVKLSDSYLKMGTLNKRWKELTFNEFKPVNSKAVKKRLIVIDFGKDKNGHEIVDGAQFMHTNDMSEVNIKGGYAQRSKDYLTNKNVFIFRNGTTGKDINIIKNEMYGVKPGGGLASVLERHVQKYIPGYKFQPGDIITSNNNVKIGKNIISKFGEGKPNFHVEEVTMDGMRSKYDLPKSEEANYKFSPYLLSKYGSGDKLNKVIYNMYDGPAARHQEAFNSILNAGSAKEAKKYLVEYEDIFKGALGENAYGKTKKILDNGGWGKNGSDLHYELKQIMTKSYQDYVLSGKAFKSHYAKFLPDMGVLKDPSGKNTVEVPEDSIVLSDQTIKNLGDPSYILTTRHPNTKRTGMLKLKVINAKDHGITDLGESMIVNNKVGYREMYFDTDGDAGPIYAVGKSDGRNFLIPEELADQAARIYTKEGGRVAEKLAPYPDNDPDSNITLENSLKMGRKSVKGGDSVGENSTLRSVMQGVIDNDEKIGGWALKAPEEGQTPAKRNEDMFLYFEKMNNASTDAVKASTLFTELKDAEVVSLSELLRNKYFVPPHGSNVKSSEKAFTKGLFKLRELYKAVDNNVDDYNVLKKSLGKYNDEVVSKRFKQQPVDQIAVVSANRMGDFPAGQTGAEQTTTHRSRITGMNNFLKENGRIEMAPDSDPAVSDFKNYFRKTKTETMQKFNNFPAEKRTIKKEGKDNIIDYYNSIEGNLNQQQKRNIAWWLLTKNEANWAAWTPGDLTSNNVFQNRFSYIFNDAPEIAIPYYTADTSIAPVNNSQLSKDIAAQQRGLPVKAEPKKTEITNLSALYKSFKPKVKPSDFKNLQKL